jgi:hypothetical protein
MGKMILKETNGFPEKLGTIIGLVITVVTFVILAWTVLRSEAAREIIEAQLRPETG